MNNSKEKLTKKEIARSDFTEALFALLQANIVGVGKMQEENAFIFTFPGGKSFRVLVEEI